MLEDLEILVKRISSLPNEIEAKAHERREKGDRLYQLIEDLKLLELKAAHKVDSECDKFISKNIKEYKTKALLLSSERYTNYQKTVEDLSKETRLLDVELDILAKKLYADHKMLELVTTLLSLKKEEEAQKLLKIYHNEDCKQSSSSKKIMRFILVDSEPTNKENITKATVFVDDSPKKEPITVYAYGENVLHLENIGIGEFFTGVLEERENKLAFSPDIPLRPIVA